MGSENVVHMHSEPDKYPRRYLNPDGPKCFQRKSVLKVPTDAEFQKGIDHPVGLDRENQISNGRTRFENMSVQPGVKHFFIYYSVHFLHMWSLPLRRLGISCACLAV